MRFLSAGDTRAASAFVRRCPGVPLRPGPTPRSLSLVELGLHWRLTRLSATCPVLANRTPQFITIENRLLDLKKTGKAQTRSTAVESPSPHRGVFLPRPVCFPHRENDRVGKRAKCAVTRSNSKLNWRAFIGAGVVVQLAVTRQYRYIDTFRRVLQVTMVLLRLRPWRT